MLTKSAIGGSKLILLAIALLAATVFLLFPISNDTQFLQALLNSGHVWLFLALTLLSLIIFKPQSLLSFALIVIFILGFSAAIELIQPMTGRSSNIQDMLMNGVGIFAALLLYTAAVLSQLVNTYRIWMALAATLIVVVSLLKPAVHLAANYSLPPLPVIANFESTFSKLKIESLGAASYTIISPRKATVLQSNALLVDFIPSQYSGFRIIEPPNNWTAYDSFHFEVYNANNEAYNLELRIDDVHHNTEFSDRFNVSLAIEPGENTIRIPIASIQNMGRPAGVAPREMDMGNISHLLIFTVAPKTTIQFYFDNFELR